MAEKSTPLVDEAVGRAKEGDRDALQFLYIRHADQVYGYIERIVRDPHEAEDLTQAVFTKLIRVIGRYEQRGVPFSAWLMRVARNTALDFVRARRLVPCEEVQPVDEGEPEVASERLWYLRDALEQLPAAQREVLILRHFAGLSPTEIADRLGKTEGSVHSLHHRGRTALQGALSAVGVEPVTSAATR